MMAGMRVRLLMWIGAGVAVLAVAGSRSMIGP